MKSSRRQLCILQVMQDTTWKGQANLNPPSVRLATSLFPKSPRETHSTARNLSDGPKQKEVGKQTCWIRTIMNINELV